VGYSHDSTHGAAFAGPLRPCMIDPMQTRKSPLLFKCPKRQLEPKTKDGETSADLLLNRERGTNLF
jgi:hypothetical protein